MQPEMRHDVPPTPSVFPVQLVGQVESDPERRDPQPNDTHAIPFQAWLARNAPRRYWRVFLVGLLAYFAAALLLRLDLNLHAVPLVILLASALVPVTFLLYCWETGAFAEMPATVIGLIFISGACIGLLAASILEDTLLASIPFPGVVMVAAVEETAKAAVVIAFLRDKRLHGELDGIILGAVAGIGFAALETASYGFNAFLTGYTASLIHSGSAATAPVVNQATTTGIATMTGVLLLRVVVSIFGQGVWTAIICAAVWRERAPSVLRITGGVLLAFGLVVVLHATWDSVATHSPLSLILLPLSAFAGLWILRFFIREAVARAKFGPLTLVPEPLFGALLRYLQHPLSGPAARQAASKYATPADDTVLAQAPMPAD